jgi:hypothetical protein
LRGESISMETHPSSKKGAKTVRYFIIIRLKQWS